MNTLPQKAEAAQQRYNLLPKKPQAQARTIARHYTSTARLAVNLDRILDQSKLAETDAFDIAVNIIVEQIKKYHEEDFGIKLEWKEQQ